MKTMKLKEGLFWNGVLNPDLRVFDIIMNTEFGTTYNSYVLKGSEKTVLFETAKLEFWEEYRASLEELGVLNSIDYIVVNHTEPDHAGSIAKILAHNPGATVIGTGTALSFLREVGNADFYGMAVRDGEKISLGDKTLRFMILPNLHWPDTMYTYVEEDKVLFTCDSFGSHYSFEGVVRSRVTDVEGYMRATKYYFDNIIGPFKDPYMVNALERIAPLAVEMICTGHGPVHDSHIDEIISIYKEWCNYDEAMRVREEKKDRHRTRLVVIPYVSAYGYTGELAERIAEGIRAVKNIEVETYDMVTADSQIVQEKLGAADGILFGTPTIIGEALAPIWQLTLGLFAPVHGGKLASAFGSYAWSGEGVPHILERLKQLNMQVMDGFTVHLKPSETDMKDAYNFGYAFGVRLVQRRQRSEAGAGSGKVKCLVCGEVFNSSVEICPVCGVGTDKFVPVEDTTTDFRKDTEETFVILGGGGAAHQAAKAVRERNRTAKIQMITEESYRPYNRPMLTKALLADFSGNQLAIENEKWYADSQVDLVLSTRVTAVDTRKKKVFAGDKAFSYDKLIYALGAGCFRVSIKGADKPHVHTVRNIQDTRDIAAGLLHTEQVVCIGGGVMGLEGAWELKKGGYDVTLLEVAEGLLPKQLDDAGSDILADIVVSSGVRVVTGAKIEEITDQEVILKGGIRYPAQLVIMSTGMRANAEIAKNAGLAADSFVKVNNFMETSEADVFACGDCVSVEGHPQAFWSQAVETGRIAGANAAGEETEYREISAGMMINAFDTSLFALGTNGKGREEIFRTVEMRDASSNRYEKYYFNKNVLEGVILIGDTRDMARLTRAIEDGWTYQEVFSGR